jgi:hypothetical protein
LMFYPGNRRDLSNIQIIFFLEKVLMSYGSYFSRNIPILFASVV